MKRLLFATMMLACAMPLAACDGTPPPQSAGGTAAITAVDAKLAQLEAMYQDAKLFADLVMPLAAPSRVAQLVAIEQRIETAFAVAHAAVSVAQKWSALRQAEQAIAELSAPTS